MTKRSVLGPRRRLPSTSQGPPLISLPRTEPVVELRVQTARAIAGCALCESPIGVGDRRMSLLLRLSEARQDTYGRNRVTERYNIHAGCLIDALEGGTIRSRDSCWDCGKKPALEGGRWSFKAFTTTRFAFAPLCDDCITKPRWRSCQECGIYFPHWMVSVTRTDEELLCDVCSERSGRMTRRRHEQDRDALAELRDQLLRDGLDEP